MSSAVHKIERLLGIPLIRVNWGKARGVGDGIPSAYWRAHYVLRFDLYIDLRRPGMEKPYYWKVVDGGAFLESGMAVTLKEARKKVCECVGRHW